MQDKELQIKTIQRHHP